VSPGVHFWQARRQCPLRQFHEHMEMWPWRRTVFWNWRQYTLYGEKRDTLISIFEQNFIEP